MAKGRITISDSQKRLRGTDQPCRMMENSLQVNIPSDGTMVSLPKSGLKGTAKKVYSLVATELMNRGVQDVLSADLVIAYRREMALHHDMMRDLEKEGMTISIETKNGTMSQINPKRKIAESALAAAKSLASEFGLSPASRARGFALFIDNAPKDDFADFEIIDEQ